MGTKLNKGAYRQLIEENIAWLNSLPRCPERDHVIEIVKASEKHEYGLDEGEEIIGHETFDFSKINQSNKN